MKTLISFFIFVVLSTISIQLPVLANELSSERFDEQYLYDVTYGVVISYDIWVDVDIENQTLYVKKGNEIILQTPCVTGTKYSHDTPIGTYQVLSKEIDIFLDGYNDDGSTYHSWVNYWICFYGGYGIHDASWRYSFGGDIYTYSGSHGCINIPSDIASSVYDYVEIGTIVYIH